jgi:hypothetical protein
MYEICKGVISGGTTGNAGALDAASRVAYPSCRSGINHRINPDFIHGIKSLMQYFIL